MSKELAFTDDNDVVKYLDTTTAFNLALTANGVAFDLTNAKSILVKIANDDGYIMQQTIDLTTVTSPLGGTLSFPINQDIMNTLVPDDYDIEVWVTMKDGTQAIFPSDGTLGFSIEENLMSDTGEVIPTITLNDFQQQFDDLSSQMENAVHNVHKGDQGNPGNGIKSANNQYQLSDSPVTVPTGGWSDTILATTDQLPYLWTKIIFTYDDGTTKETNFVSSRGDTGSQGPIGPEGPQGKQGNGLVVRGKADKEENLPTTGNNQGDGYLVGTDLYIWIDGSWQNMGSITPDLADYVKVADMNNALNTKVTDNKDGTEQLNGVQVQPYNKLSDVTNLRNIVLQTDNVVTYTAKGGGGEVLETFPLYSGFSSLPSGTQIYYSYDLVVTNADGGNQWLNWTSPWSNFAGRESITTDGINHFQGTTIIPDKDIVSGQTITSTVDNSHATYQLTNLMVVVGSIPVTHLPAPEDKQDKIGYTPADDSKVAHLSGDEEIAGTKTFDTAPIDKTTGHPYITKDSVPAVSSTLADTTKDANFTGKLQKSGIDVATTTDVNKAVNTAVSPLNINTNWVSLSVDSSQIKDTDWDSTVTHCNYRIAHSTLYLTGKYKMLVTSNNKSRILFQLPTNIVSQISFPSTNEFQIGIIQAIARVPIMFMISLTNDGKISTTTSPYDMNSSNFGAQYGLGLINAAIPLN